VPFLLTGNSLLENVATGYMHWESHATISHTDSNPKTKTGSGTFFTMSQQPRCYPRRRDSVLVRDDSEGDGVLRDRIPFR
jgi:hypothetical protein